MAVALGTEHILFVSHESGEAFSGGSVPTMDCGYEFYESPATLVKADKVDLDDCLDALDSRRVRQVAAGNFHSAFVMDDGNLLVCGTARHGKLGLDLPRLDTTMCVVPTVVPRVFFGGDVVMVSCGESHTAAVRADGTVFTFGCGQYGRLGHGNQNHVGHPQWIHFDYFENQEIEMVACGGAHTIALSRNGDVFAWGRGHDGQLGLDNNADYLRPAKVDRASFDGEGVVFVAAGSFHSLAITSSGKLYTWGTGNHGQLGLGNQRLSVKVPTLVVFEEEPGSRLREPVLVATAACGDMHTLVVTSRGSLWACGSNDGGQLGVQDRAHRFQLQRVARHVFEEHGVERVVAVAAGSRSSAAITDDGSLWTWGLNTHFHILQNRKNAIYTEPCKVERAILDNNKVGRCLPLSRENALAFLMSVHERLGVSSEASALESEEGLSHMILDFACLDVQDHPTRYDAERRLDGTLLSAAWFRPPPPKDSKTPHSKRA